jgi:4'-phosphopantetheinyl transferase
MILHPTQVHVWIVALEYVERADPRKLSQEEQQRAREFIEGRDRDKYVAAHCALRRVLGQYTDGPVRFVYNNRGKPDVVERDIQFSFSRSADRAAIAITRTAAVGIDIEKIASKGPAFYEDWTRKEAYLKGKGEGLTDATARGRIVPDSTWYVTSLDVVDGYSIALAVQMRSPDLRVFKAEW